MFTRTLLVLVGTLFLLGPGAFAQNGGNSGPPPRPTIEIVSPTDGTATNGDLLTVVVEYEAWVDPETGDIGNVKDVDLLLNGSLIETIPHRPPVTVGTDSFSVDLTPFADEAIVLVARAFQGNRRAGHAGLSQEVTVVIDRTPPEIQLIWPPVDQFGTDRTDVEIEGAATDDFSGVQGVELLAPIATDLTYPTFLTEQPLDTVIPAGQTSVPTQFTLAATDNAGNSASRTFTVNFTRESTIPYIDPEVFVEIEGLVLSPKHAFIVFSDQAVAADRHSIVEEFGGRVMAFLTNLDAALVMFEDCEDVFELGVILDDVMAVYGSDIDDMDNLVNGAQLYYLLEPRMLDNDALSTAGAYTNGNSDLAIDWIEANVPADEIREITVAIFDTGLNPAFGTPNTPGEFDGMRFIDAAPPGLSGVLNLLAPLEFSPPVDLSAAHGTLVASTLAGGNNGFGNNGAAIIKNGPPVQIIAYRIFRDHWYSSEPLVDSLSLALAADNAVERGVDVANFSFGVKLPPALLGAIGFDRDLFRRIFSRGTETFWVLAAGNDGTEVDRDIDCDFGFCNIEMPTVVSSEYLNVISVANHNPANDLLNSTSNFDDSNESVQISAAGTNVLAANGVGTYGMWNGTSAAAPIVSGAAALIRAVADVPASDLKDIRISSARPMPAANPHPGLDALAAVMLGRSVTGTARVAGITNGSDTADWDAAFVAPPGLNGFSFDFLGGDHHIEAVEVELDEIGVDVTYEDDNGDDNYSWFVEGATLPAGTTYHRFPTSGTVEDGGGCDTSGVLPESGTGTFVLTGFNLDYVGGDHHIDRVRVVFTGPPDATEIEVCYDDKNNDDNYTWSVSYAVVPAGNIVDSESTGDQFVDPENNETTENLDLGLSLTPGALPVIRGFGFDLEDDDQHLKRLMVDISSVGVVHVKFRDESAGGLVFGLNDEYTWFVDWAVVSP